MAACHKHKFTPQLVRQVLTSSRFQNRLELWTIIHALGSNTKARLEQTKMLRSNDGGLTLCYALRRLANNTQEPFRTLSLNAIDASIQWWRGKPAPKATAFTGPMVPRSRPSAHTEEVSATMARQDAGSPSTMSHSLLQDGLHQTCGSLGHPLQPQKKPSMTGQLRTQPRVVANPGPVTRVRHSILRTLTGSCPALFFTPSSNRTLRSLRKDPWPTKSSRPRRNFKTNCVLA